MISEISKKRIQFNNGIIPVDFEDLSFICPLGEILNESHYERAINIVRKLSLLDEMAEGQERYLDKISEYVIEYEDETSIF